MDVQINDIEARVLGSLNEKSIQTLQDQIEAVGHKLDNFIDQFK